MLSFFFSFYSLIFSHGLLENSFNIYSKCSSNGTLSNTKTHMRDATEGFNSIRYALFAVIQAIFSNPNGLEIKEYELYLLINC